MEVYGMARLENGGREGTGQKEADHYLTFTIQMNTPIVFPLPPAVPFHISPPPLAATPLIEKIWTGSRVVRSREVC